MSFQDKEEVIIGGQVWMTRNLDVTTFRNGEPIPQASSNEEWEIARRNYQPAWCYYDNDPKNGKKYGKLYNWYAIEDPRGLAPDGWHIPTYEEWTTLSDFLGGWHKAGEKMKSKIGRAPWDGTNESGFSALPGGLRRPGGTFRYGGVQKKVISPSGYWWSSTMTHGGVIYNFGLHCGDLFLHLGSWEDSMYYGFSVRCLRD